MIADDAQTILSALQQAKKQFGQSIPQTSVREPVGLSRFLGIVYDHTKKHDNSIYFFDIGYKDTIPTTDVDSLTLNNNSLTNRKIAGLNLLDAQLQYVSFNQNDLKCIDFIKSNLSFVSISESNCKTLNFTNSHVSFSDFKKCDLVNSTIKGTSLIHVKFSESNITRSVFKDCDLRDASFIDVNFSNVIFKFSNLLNTKFIINNSNFFEVKFINNANLDKSNFLWVNEEGKEKNIIGFMIDPNTDTIKAKPKHLLTPKEQERLRSLDCIAAADLVGKIDGLEFIHNTHYAYQFNDGLGI